ncbi:tripartite tricarboxylate transporter substrate binding protein [Afifella sp. IM 167]|uniref:Bug family tripartite tricarboxylate transporter substrate binding protein n=1 Tax=Afifella sp. IM 167 TaxID=2033586 RepID=UPI001CCC72E1|nr:tripartite tricarboxylate transporter substrate binding protein [Afifella sp. IM 167]
MSIIRKAAGAALCAFALAAPAVPAQAQDAYPEKPIRLVVPYGPGGATDLAARALASVLPEFLGQGVIVVNVPGAGGAVGAQQVEESEPDGYTMLMTAIGANVLRPALSPDLPYSYDDFDYLARTQINPNVLIVKADSSYKSFDDFAAALKAEGASFKYGTAGAGNVTHLGPNMLFGELGLPASVGTPVHYDSDGAALLALLQGEVDFAQGNLASFASALQSGAVRGLAMTTPERVEGFDDIPTYTEVGLPEVSIVGWRGVAGPPGLPKEVEDAWQAALAKTTEAKSWISLVKKLGDEPGYMPKEAYDPFVKKDYERYVKIAEEIGLRK